MVQISPSRHRSELLKKKKAPTVTVISAVMYCNCPIWLESEFWRKNGGWFLAHVKDTVYFTHFLRPSLAVTHDLKHDGQVSAYFQSHFLFHHKHKLLFGKYSLVWKLRQLISASLWRQHRLALCCHPSSSSQLAMEDPLLQVGSFFIRTTFFMASWILNRHKQCILRFQFLALCCC